MSVRNQYAKNYTKVTPFPPSNKLVAESKLTAKRSNIHAVSNKAAKTDYENIDDIHQNEAQQVRKNGRKIRRYTGKLDQLARKTRDSYDTGKQRYDINQSDNRYDKPERDSSPDVVDIWSNDSERNGHVTDHHGDVSSPRDRSRVAKNRDDEEIKSLRPKSARPESRWERRMEEVAYDTHDMSPPRPMRPKSARPESRMFRMATEQGLDDYNGKVELPQRPKTSYGQRRRGGASPDRIELERPKSRIDNYPNQFMYDGEYNDIKSKKRDKRSKQTTTSVSHNQNEIYGTSPQQDFTKWRSKTVLDLNSGIDDIDLDVDPVLYFMQDDHEPTQSAETKQSLSKDTLEFIGNANLMRQSKVPTGYHSNYTDKHKSTPRKPDSYYGNRLQRGHNPISNGDRYSSSERHAMIKDNSFVTDQSNLRQYPGDTHTYGEPRRDKYKYLSSNRSKDLIHESRDLQNPPHNGRYRKNGGGASNNQTGQSYRRHPRRLQPITAVMDNNT